MKVYTLKIIKKGDKFEVAIKDNEKQIGKAKGSNFEKVMHETEMIIEKYEGGEIYAKMV